MKTLSNRNFFGRIIALLLVLVMMGSLVTAVSAAYPKADELVADEAGVLSESTIRQIKKANRGLTEDYGVAIAVCTVKTTDGQDIAEYARELFTEWKMGEGVLLLIATEDKNYYMVQSTGIDDALTNEMLKAIRDGYLEEDFASGNIDSGVLKTVSKLAGELEAVIDEAPSAGEADEEEEENKGTTFGSVLVTILKVILYIALFALAAFVILFIVAMFNDDAAALLQKYVFRRGKTNPAKQTYYDERLYGNSRQRQPQRPQNRPQGQTQRPQNRSQNQYPAAGQSRRPDPNRMYNSDGTVRRVRNNDGRRSNNDYNDYNDYNGYGY